MPNLSRRTLLKLGAVAGAAHWIAPLEARSSGRASPRTYHVCLTPEVVDTQPELLQTMRDAGVSAVWIAGFFYGHSPYSIELLRRARGKAEALGFAVHLITVPLGHPGDSLGSTKGPFPLTPPAHWKMGVRVDGGSHSGTSLHDPATAENVKALEKLSATGTGDAFLDDDFRLAVSPGMIGGCFCRDHRLAFCKTLGYADKQWSELRADAQARRWTPAVKAFVDYSCDELTASFRAQKAAWTGGRLGIMVMYLGSEKAGIRLGDYRDDLLRVGEFHFDDGSFGSVRGKTAELFSSLFHCRFAPPERAFSETTAYPHNALSAANLGAKLAVSTLSDVRTTMFMSGLTPFPATHWGPLKAAMKKNAEVHALVAGHPAKGPFKHYWGERSRFVGDDNPFSLFLAAGVPFEVCDAPPADGWTFLSDPDADAAASGALKTAGTQFVHRSKSAVPDGRAVAERLEELFAFKREILPRLKGVPVVVEDKPCVLSWHPAVRRAVVWNLSAQDEDLTVRLDATERKVRCGALSVESVEFGG